MTTTIGKLFDSGIPNNIVARVDEAIDDLTKPVSDGAYAVKSLSLDAGLPTLSLFDTPVKLGATTTLEARIAAASESFQPFDEGTTLQAPAGTSYASLALEAKLSASGQGGGKAGVLAISAEASATAQFAYLHLLPVPGTDTRLTALIDLARTTQLPQFAAFDRLRDGEVLHFNALLNLDFGIKAKYGADLDINETVAVAADLALPVQAHAQFSADASLGFGLYDAVSVTVAKAGQRNDGWIRIHFSRTHRNRITFGAAFSVAVQYDAATGVDMLLDKTFAQLQMPKLVEDIREVAVFAQKPWSEITTTLSAKAAAAVVALVDDTGWKQWLENDPRVQQLLNASKWIVSTYDKLEDKVKSIWEELLARLDDAGFAKMRARIHKLATLDVSTINFQSLVSGQVDDVIDLIELFSGKDLEEMIVSGKIGEGLKQAIAVAKRVDDAIDSAPDKAIAYLRGFAQRTGIAKVVEWLRTTGSSVQGLETAVDTWIGDVVEKLVGKALDQVNPGDVARLQAFAAKVQKLIDAPEKLKTKLENAVAKLKGDFTISLAVEMSRVSETSALLDLEFDSSNKKAANAVSRFLPSGNVQQLLETLNTDIDSFDIRELILTSRRIRTSTGSLFFSFLGSKITEQQSRIEESTIRFEGGVDAPKKRSGSYSGGNVIRRSDAGATLEGAAFVRIEAESTDLQSDAKYDSFDTSIRLTYVREDANTRQEELSSITAILGDLGMLGNVVIDSSTVAAQTRFAVEVNLPSEAVTALSQDIANENAWNLDMRNAGSRWFKEQGLNPGDVSRGNEMAVVLANSNFGSMWTDPAKFKQGAIDDAFLPVRIGISPNGEDVEIRYFPLQRFVRARALRYGRHEAFKPVQSAQPTPAELQKATSLAASLFSVGAVEWPVPLFNFWMILSRLSRIAPDTLKQARVVATLRSRANDKADWSDPQWFTVPDGVGIWPTIRARCFPIK